MEWSYEGGMVFDPSSRISEASEVASRSDCDWQLQRARVPRGVADFGSAARKRHVGAAAHGNGGRYAYYVCFSRHRYGTQHCDADRLPADQLDDAILERLEVVLAHEQIVTEAIQQAFTELDQERPRRQAELQRIDDEIRKTSATLERYFHAFEASTMSEAACGPRIEALTARSPDWKRGAKSSPSTRPKSQRRSPARTCTISTPTSAT